MESRVQRPIDCRCLLGVCEYISFIHTYYRMHMSRHGTYNWYIYDMLDGDGPKNSRQRDPRGASGI